MTLRFRRPVEADHPTIVRLVDEWWAGQRVRDQLPRLWFRHFSGTSWIAETGDGDLAGFVIGFVSPDRPERAVLHMVGVDPNRRRRGVGRSLYERFSDDAARLGAHQIEAACWPANRAAIGFLQALGLVADSGPGSQSLYGSPAFADYDGPGEDRAIYVARLAEVPTR